MRRGWSLSVLLFVLILFSACVEREEGCLDPAASNFDVSADDPCCCVFPELVMSVQHRYDSTLFARGEVVDSSTDLRILDYALYISSVSFLSESGNESESQEMLMISKDCLNPRDTVIGSTLFYSENQERSEVGEWRMSADYREIAFDVGLPESLRMICPEEENAVFGNNKLFNEQTGLYTSFFMRLDIKGELKEIMLSEGLLGSFVLPYSEPLQVFAGEDLVTDIFIDYKILLDGVNEESTEQEILSLMLENSSRSFYLNQ